MLSALIWRRSTPVPPVLPPTLSEREALSDIGTPSIIMEVPKALLAVLWFSVRMVSFSSEVISDELISWPGRSCIMSLRLVACRWSMAIRPMLEAVEDPAALGLAVTTTSSRARLDSLMVMVKVLSLRKLNCFSKSSKPSICTCILALPTGTFSRVRRPSASEMS